MSNLKGRKNQSFSQGNGDSRNLRGETLNIAASKYVNIFSFAVLHIKLWLEEDRDLDTDHLLYSFKFIQSKVQN